MNINLYIKNKLGFDTFDLLRKRNKPEFAIICFFLCFLFNLVQGYCFAKEINFFEFFCFLRLSVWQ